MGINEIISTDDQVESLVPNLSPLEAVRIEKTHFRPFSNIQEILVTLI